MEAILQSVLVASLWVGIAVLGPGLALHFLLRRRETQDSDPVEQMIGAVALGLLFNATLYWAGSFVERAGLADRRLIVALQATAAVLATIPTLLIFRGQLRRLLNEVRRSLARPENALLTLVCLVAAVVTLRHYPLVNDCAELASLQFRLFGLETPNGVGVGEIGYQSLVYAPAILLPKLPVCAVAAGLKPMLCLLLGLAVSRLCKGTRLVLQGYEAVAMLVLVLLSCFGLFGVMQLGKDSIFGITFTLLYVAELMNGAPGDVRWYLRAGLLCACGITAGVIALPYIGLITGLYYCVAFRELNRLRYVVTLAACCACFACPLVMHMFHVSAWFYWAALVGGVLAYALAEVGLAVLARRISRGEESGAAPDVALRPGLRMVVRGIWAFMPLAVLSGGVVGCLQLLPVRLPIVAASGVGADVASSAIFLWPIDGSVNLRGFLLPEGNPYWHCWFQAGCHGCSHILALCGLAGMFAVYFQRHTARNRGLQALTMFPFTMLLVALGLAHLPRPPISGFHIWDMVKDIPQWCGGPLIGLFSLVAVASLASLLSALAPTRARRVVSGSVFLCGAALLIYSQVRYAGARLATLGAPAEFTRIGGFEDVSIARLHEHLWQLRRGPMGKMTAPQFYMASNSCLAGAYWGIPQFAYFTDRIELTDNANVKTRLQRLPIALVGRKQEVEAALGRYPALAVREVVSLPAGNESLFWIEGTAPGNPAQ